MIETIDINPTTDKSLQGFDYSMLSSINQCPTFGILRYGLGKTMQTTGRSMALEAGGAAHEVFSAHRLYALKEYASLFYNMQNDYVLELYRKTGNRLFGADRFGEMEEAVKPSEDYHTRTHQFCLTALYNSGFSDSPLDKRRTVTNIEELALAYIDRFDWKDELPIVIGDYGNEFVGIEIPIDVTVTYTMTDGEVRDIRFIGRADGIHYKDATRSVIRLHENKTASRLNDAWELSFETSHQVTGYMLALSSMLKLTIEQAVIIGTALPMPKTYSMGGLTRLVVNRYPFQFSEWAEWLLHTVDLYEQYKDNPINAPKYTIACNRYFSPCMFIPFCAIPPEDRQSVIDTMREDRWSPLNDKHVGVQDE